MRPPAVILAVAAAIVGCSTQSPAAQHPVTTSGPTGPAVATYHAALAASFPELRNRPMRLPVIRDDGCPVSRMTTITFTAATIRANGTAPFYFGPYGGFQPTVGDGNKTPWNVAPGYPGRILVRGRRIDGPGDVAFGFWPRGYGTPASAPDVPILFKRTDAQGRTTEYQPELDIDSPAGGRGDAQLWSFPAAGCYAMQADGDTFTNVTVISVR